MRTPKPLDVTINLPEGYGEAIRIEPPKAACELCSFPTSPYDRLPLGRGVVHAACALDATKKLGVRAAVLLKRVINPNKEKA